MNCARCVGLESKCAFKSGTFDHDNHSCGTLYIIRRIAEVREGRVYGDDQSCFVLPPTYSADFPDDIEHFEFVVLNVYKDRGRTEGAWALRGSVASYLTLAEAELVVRGYLASARVADELKKAGVL